ncbi:hypothetical protein [Turicibacter bilis]|uniref:hypothetical protein n=1 Tax=Turicibacter bilis TaxID=2735723 RepID=UPI0031B9FCDD
MSLAKATECMKLKTILSGIGILTETSVVFNDDVLMIDCDNVKVYIPSSEISIYPVKKSLIQYIGQKIEYIIIGINEVEDFAIGSCKLVQELKIQEFINQVNLGKLEQFEAKIIKIQDYGAKMEYNGIEMLLYNDSFADDYTQVKDIHQVGDCINVSVKTIKNDKILLEAVKKYQAKSYLPFAEFVPGDMVLGEVRNIRESAVYVNLMPGIDGMASVKEWLPIEKGDVVRFKINQVREDGRIRGRILENITKNPAPRKEEVRFS